jgi:hypothetical protein
VPRSTRRHLLKGNSHATRCTRLFSQRNSPDSLSHPLRRRGLPGDRRATRRAAFTDRCGSIGRRDSGQPTFDGHMSAAICLNGSAGKGWTSGPSPPCCLMQKWGSMIGQQASSAPFPQCGPSSGPLSRGCQEIVVELSGYSLDHLCEDGAFILFRAHTRQTEPPCVLLVVPAASRNRAHAASLRLGTQILSQQDVS